MTGHDVMLEPVVVLWVPLIFSLLIIPIHSGHLTLVVLGLVLTPFVLLSLLLLFLLLLLII